MKLLHGTLRPGRVIEVLGGGKIRVEAPGLFSAEDKDLLPPVYPWFGQHANSYSEPLEGDEVWVMNFEDNPLQLHWLRKDDRTTPNQSLEGEENVEVLCNREAEDGWATIYFSNGTGWMFRNGDSYMQIRADGSIILNPNIPSRCIHLCPDSISLGSENKSAHPAAFGDQVQDVLETISTCLATMRQAASTNPYTAAIGAAIGGTPEKIQSVIPTIASVNVTMD